MDKDKKIGKSEVLIIIPAYNESGNIVRVVDEIRNKYSEYDYIVVNDGSLDQTRKVCHANHIHILDLPVNVGLTGAVRAGMRYANYHDYKYAIQLDGDGQHKPEYIKTMLKAMIELNADIIIGSRFKTQRKPITARMIGSQLITYAIFITTRGKYIGDVTSGMRLFNRKMIKRFGYQLNYRPEPDTLAYLINSGIKIEEVQVDMRERVEGESYLDVINSFKYMTHVLINILITQWFRNR
ncbi:glycosyltransferase family 2 protein [Butyrivibrio fibrisolvens]|uniref:glycosyltransferase family 2 protein n=1 Tax=Butyrivibrio fibrisolvens TaxID=831 RepID=UPI000427742A|nr:glycosyltransferase family 2 protein [Butyrivibrio fibrisolvens]